jgi:sugar phosphate isomerase/epimerase
MAAFKMAFIGEGGLEQVRADAAFARAHGFAGLEYNFHPKAHNPTHPGFPDLSASHARKMRAAFDAHGLACAMFGLWGYNHTSTDQAERSVAHEMLDRAIDLAASMGAEVFCTGAGERADASYDAQADAFAEVFAPRVGRIIEAGMKPVLYALHSRSFLDSIEAYQAIWARLPEARIKYDPANWYQKGKDYVAIARYHGDRIGHVHIKEHLYHDGELASQPAAGMGDIAFGKVMAFLYEHDYRGWLSFEPHGPCWSQGELRRTMCLLSKRHIERFLV